MEPEWIPSFPSPPRFSIQRAIGRGRRPVSGRSWDIQEADRAQAFAPAPPPRSRGSNAAARQGQSDPVVDDMDDQEAILAGRRDGQEASSRSSLRSRATRNSPPGAAASASRKGWPCAWSSDQDPRLEALAETVFSGSRGSRGYSRSRRPRSRAPGPSPGYSAGAPRGHGKMSTTFPRPAFQGRSRG